MISAAVGASCDPSPPPVHGPLITWPTRRNWSPPRGSDSRTRPRALGVSALALQPVSMTLSATVGSNVVEAYDPIPSGPIATGCGVGTAVGSGLAVAVDATCDPTLTA